MAEPLTNYYDISVASNIAYMLLHVAPNFDCDGFIEHVRIGYDNLELMRSGQKLLQHKGVSSLRF
ncbi:MAG: hypothetical protein ACI9LE_000713 [Paraglaciecola sp.]